VEVGKCPATESDEFFGFLEWSEMGGSVELYAPIVSTVIRNGLVIRRI